MSKHHHSSPSVRGDDGTQLHARGKINQALVTPEMVEQRARELALIAGREPNHPNASDRIQAKKELLGDDSADAAADESEIVPSGMGAPPTSRGTHTKNHLPTDDEIETQTVQDGVDAAEHEQMLQAGKSQTRNEG